VVVLPSKAMPSGEEAVISALSLKKASINLQLQSDS